MNSKATAHVIENFQWKRTCKSNFWVKVLEQKEVLEYLRQEIRYLIRKGGKLSEQFNIDECKDKIRLHIEKTRMEEQVQHRELLGGVMQTMGFLAEKYLLPVQKMIICLDCNTLCRIPKDNKPVVAFQKLCKMCNLKNAEIYQPECGHVVICKECFLNTVVDVTKLV